MYAIILAMKANSAVSFTEFSLDGWWDGGSLLTAFFSLADEFTEFELYSSGKLRYANNSNYKNDSMIRKELHVSPAVVDEFKRIVSESGIITLDDSKWKEPDESRHELECKIGSHHISFTCSETGSLTEIQKSKDPEGLKIFYFLCLDLKALVLALISCHFKKRPV